MNKNTVQILADVQVTNQQTIDSLASKGIKVNKGVKALMVQRQIVASYNFLESIHAELDEQDPDWKLSPEEKVVARKKREQAEMNRFDNSPCPMNERVIDPTETFEGFVDMMRTSKGEGKSEWMGLLGIEE